MNVNEFMTETRDFAQKVDDFILNHPFIQKIEPEEVRRGTLQYLQSGGKRLRPYLVKECCEAVGGNPDWTLPAAASVEVFHTWTLVHDDIIDRDDMRRGQPSLHRHYEKGAREDHQIAEHHVGHYGLSLSLLTGDVQNGFAFSLLCDLQKDLPHDVVIKLIQEMASSLLVRVMGGEVLDVQFSFQIRQRPSLSQLLEMISGKTGALLEFCAIAGASIGLRKFEPESAPTRHLSKFARDCGIAFQLHDDLLGIMGDEKHLGKKVGADIREGKYTPIIHFALEDNDSKHRVKLLESLGEPDLTENDIADIREILRDVGAIKKTEELASSLLVEALHALHQLEPGKSRDNLETFAHYLLERRY